MITDDPGTPGSGKWENNIAILLGHRPNEWSIETPQFDLNYGWGDHIQLTLQGGPVILKRDDHGPVSGLGGTEAAVKWRFFDEEKSGFDMSMFPRIIFNLSQAAVRRGLAEDGTRFQIPLQFAKAFRGFDLDLEWGPLVSTVGPAQWLYGIVVGVDASKTTTLMAELHGTSRTNFSRDELTVNLGIRQKLNDHCIFIGSLGHELRSPQARALIGYAGVQLLF